MSDTDNDILASYFTPYTADAAAADTREASKMGGVRHLQMSKLPPGSYLFRFLPPRPGRKSLFVIKYTHFVKGAEKTRAVPCARLMEGAPCKVCSVMEALDSTGLAADVAASKELAPEFSVLSTVLDMTVPFDPEHALDQCAVLEFKKGIHTDLLALRNNPHAGGDFSHPTNGFGIAISKSGSGMKTEYGVLPSMSARGLIAPTMEHAVAILKDAPDAWSFARTLTAEEVDAALVECGYGSFVNGQGVQPRPPAGGNAASMLNMNLSAPRR